MYTKIAQGEEFYKAIKEGIALVADPVSDTLGAKGRTVLINEKGKGNHATKDGYNVSMSIRPKDPLLSAGAKVVQDATSQSVFEAGDGTTTTTVLVRAMVNEGIRHISAGANPIDLKRGIDIAKCAVVDFLKENSFPVNAVYEILKHVATVSSNNDVELGENIAKGLHKVGIDGIMKFDISKTSESYVEFKKGIEFDEGYISNHLMTDDDGFARYNDCYVLITEEVISSVEQILPALEISGIENKPLVIIASDFIKEVPASIVTNRLKNDAPILAVRAYGRDSLRRDLLDDIAAITGGKLISKAYGNSLKTVTREHLGVAKVIEANDNKCQVVGSFGEDDKRIDQMITYLANMEKETNDEKQKVALKTRISRLRGVTAYMYIGSSSDSEKKEKFDRIDDAVRATRAAMEEGVLPGGGVALLRALEALEYTDHPDVDINTGIKIVRDILDAPIIQMMENAGVKRKDVIINDVVEKDFSYGYNLESEAIEDFYDSGIIDPTKVVRVAIETAASVAGTILNTKRIVYEE
jgi:chaperonin GroEL